MIITINNVNNNKKIVFELYAHLHLYILYIHTSHSHSTIKGKIKFSITMYILY